MGRFVFTILWMTYLFSGNVFASAPSQPSQAQTVSSNSENSPTLNQVKSLYQAGKNSEAKAIAVNYLQKQPNDYDVLLFLALIEIKEKNNRDAENHLKKILISKPNYLDARIALIRLKLNAQQSMEASRLIDEGLKQNPQQSDLLLLKQKLAITEIIALKKEGRIAIALQKGQEYLKTHPNDLPIRQLLAAIYVQQKNYLDAQLQLTTILQQKPNDIDARILLVKIKMEKNDYQAAKNLVQEGLVQTPNDSELKVLDKKIDSLKSEHEKKKKIRPTPSKSSTEKSVKEASTDSSPSTSERPRSNLITLEKPNNKEGPQALSEIKKLREEGKLDLAERKAINYLKANPNDQDVNLMLGLIYFQKKEYGKAEKQFKTVLQKTPGYIDARVGLIKIKMIKKDYNQAQVLLNEGFKISPQKEQLILLKKQLVNLKTGVSKRASKPVVTPEMLIIEHAKQLIIMKRYSEAEALLKRMIRECPHKKEFYIALADYYLYRHRDMEALLVVRYGLRCNPFNYDLIIKEGEIHVILRQYGLAARSYHCAQLVEPENKKAIGLLKELDEYSPRYKYGINEVGIWSDNAYVSDLHSVWDWSGIYYSRETSYGRITGRINYASRLHLAASQLELDYSPRFTRNIYLDLMGSYSNQPAIFPTYSVGAEPYVDFPNWFEISAGAKYSRIKRTYFRTITGSLNFYPGQYWLSFRPYYFEPKPHSPTTNVRAKTSILYTAKARRYFSTDDHYIGIGGGSGRSPDLADLLTVDFIVIKNSFVNADYSFPIFHYSLIVDLGIGYQRWQYPSGLVRRIYDGLVSFKYRF